ncbi:MAG: cytochrome d ubiquinol oxidase subunit II [Hyphomicrobiales bacterium]|nr:cytochrome d ubiquinol oxidase subunit II [Hyphomicrobiales bacterium]
MDIYLPLIWAGLLAVAVGLYVILDGFDLGIGILFPLARDERTRDQMMNAVAPFWDGNETWLVLGGGGLWVAFPKAYAAIMPALYLPIIVMLLALVFRGVAFEFRFVSKPHHGFWDVAFAAGSILASLAQGVVLGGLLQGIKLDDNGAFAGGPFDWATPFSLLCGLGLVFGYALLGAGFLMMRTEGAAATLARRYAPFCLGAVAVAALVVSLWTPIAIPRIAERWFARPNIFYLWPLPALTVFLIWRIWHSVAGGGKVEPFFAAVGVFILCFVGLAISNFPLLVPPSLTLWQTAAAPASQIFLLIGVVFLLPMVLAYTVFVYWTFRGKLAEGEGYH